MRKIMIFAAVGVAAASVFSQTFAVGKYGIGIGEFPGNNLSDEKNDSKYGNKFLKSYFFKEL